MMFTKSTGMYELQCTSGTSWWQIQWHITPSFVITERTDIPFGILQYTLCKSHHIIIQLGNAFVSEGFPLSLNMETDKFGDWKLSHGSFCRKLVWHKREGKRKCFRSIHSIIEKKHSGLPNLNVQKIMLTNECILTHVCCKSQKCDWYGNENELEYGINAQWYFWTICSTSFYNFRFKTGFWVVPLHRVIKKDVSDISVFSFLPTAII